MADMKRIVFLAAVMTSILSAQPTKCNLVDCNGPATTAPRIAVLLPNSLKLQFALLDPAGSIVAQNNSAGMLVISAPGGGTAAVQSTYADEFTIVTAANQTITLGHTPAAGKLFAVYKNGVRLRPGATFDYTLSGMTITVIAAQGFNIGDSIEVEYYW
jgi:hypothetical protein